jgi:flagellar basal body-associated protein FliL
MIPNITPEDRSYWDKKMAQHAARQKRTPTKVIVQIILVVVLITLGGVIYTVFHEPTPPPRDPQIPFDDSMQQRAGDISRDSALDEMKKTPAGIEYDSIVKRRAEQ